MKKLELIKNLPILMEKHYGAVFEKYEVRENDDGYKATYAALSIIKDKIGVISLQMTTHILKQTHPYFQSLLTTKEGLSLVAHLHKFFLQSIVGFKIQCRDGEVRNTDDMTGCEIVQELKRGVYLNGQWQTY